MTLLREKIAARIRDHGPISLYDYIAACLYDADYGYYSVKAAVGREGDFTTAPEISQIFGELIGLWAGTVWRQMGSPEPIRLTELGPGRGTLMADALRALKIVPGFLDSATIHLIETSREMQAQQKAALAKFHGQVHWHEFVGDIASGPAIVIANEFVDCLPVRQFVYETARDEWRERVVTYVDDRFMFGLSDGIAAFDDVVTKLVTPPVDGDILELRPGLRALMQELMRRETPMAGLIVDYGSDRSGYGDTVQAVRKHGFANLFEAPGETDITAHVNFAELKLAALKHGLTPHGPDPLGEWLLRMGAEARLEALLKSAQPDQRQALTDGVRRLIDPSQMGLLFKVLAITNGVSSPPPPFAA